MAMGIDMAFLLRWIPKEQIKHVSLKANLQYKAVMLLYHKEMVLEDRVVYIGYSSDLPAYNKSLQIGLILIEDGQDCSVQDIDFIELESSVNAGKLYEELKEKWYAQEYAVSFSVYNSLVQRSDLHDIIEKTSELLGNPVILIDAKSNLISFCSDQEIEDPSASHILKMGYSRQSHISDAHTEGIHKQLSENILPITVGPGLNKTKRRILGRISIGDKPYGNIIVLEYNQQITPLDVKVLSAVCSALSHIVERQSKESIKTELADVMYKSYMEALLRGESVSQVWVEGWLKHMSWSSFQHFRIIAFFPDGQNSGELTIGLENKVNCMTLHYDGIVLIIINPVNEAAFRSVTETLKSVLIQYGYKAGISRQFDNIEDLPIYYRQASTALKIGSRLSGKEDISDYSEMVTYDILLSADTKEPMGHFYCRELDKLTEHDKRFGTNYYNTLYTFLKCFGNKNLSAQKLFIHRNTLVYRLDKIVEILGADLFDGEQCLQYYLSFKINDLLDVSEQLH